MTAEDLKKLKQDDFIKIPKEGTNDTFHIGQVVIVDEHLGLIGAMVNGRYWNIKRDKAEKYEQ